MNNKQVVIIGSKGQLGTALQAVYPSAICVDSDQLDISNIQQVQGFDWSNVGVMLNAAAYTAVDAAETSEGRLTAWAVNAVAVRNLAGVANQYGITLVHISSDYVFDGSEALHTEEESFSPLGVYAQTKAAGDIAASLANKHYIVRTSWVIGQGSNFVRTMSSLADKGVKPQVVNDQIGRLTFTSTLAAGINHLLDKQPLFGTYNLSNDGEATSWAEIAKQVFAMSGASAEDVTSVTTEDYYKDKAGIAARPLQSTLDLSKIKNTGFTPAHWLDELKAYMQQS